VSSDEEPEVDLLAGLRDGKWLDAQQFAPLDYHVPGLIPEGTVLMVGAPKIGKSWLVLGIGLGVAAGGYAFGKIKVAQRPVLYLALEDGDRRLQDRCRRLLGDGEHIPAALCRIITVEPGMVLATIAKWMEQHNGDAPLVILDTLGKVMPPALAGESSYQRDYRIGSALKRIVDAHPGMSLLTNHHDRKAASEDFVDAVSGTHGLAGAADTVIVVNRRRYETTGILSVTGRDVVEGEYALRFDEGSVWRLDGDDLGAAAKAAAQYRATAGLGDRSAEILAFVATCAAGATAAEVEAALEMDDARRYLARLVAAQKLVRLKRGVYGTPPT
jgi:RecA-family ATPase